jgi:hypothetical protein
MKSFRLSFSLIALLSLAACNTAIPTNPSGMSAPEFSDIPIASEPSSESGNLESQAFASACRFLACSWNPLGVQPLDYIAAQDARSPAISLGGGHPTVAWQETGIAPGTAFEQNVVARTFLNGAWSAVRRLNDIGPGSDPALAPALSSTNANIIAFVEKQAGSLSDAVIRIKRGVGGGWGAFDPNSYSGIGMIHSTGSDVSHPAIVQDAQGNPTVAWSEYNPTTRVNNIFVWRWRNNDWVNLGSRSDRSVADGDFPKLALLANGDPILAYLSGNPDRPSLDPIHVAVKRWTVNGFRTIGPADAGAYLAHPVFSLAVDATNAPLVVMGEYGTDRHLRLLVRRRNAAGVWERLGAALQDQAAGGLIIYSLANIVVANGQVLVATSVRGNIEVRRWNASSKTWGLQGAAISAHANKVPVIAVRANGDPVVAYTSRSSEGFSALTDIRVQNWSFVPTNGP